MSYTLIIVQTRLILKPFLHAKALNMKYLKKIKVEAAKRNVPLKQLADSLNITEEGLKRALKNDTLNVHQLNTICAQLSINVAELFAKENGVDRRMEHKLRFLSNKVFC